jgi:methyl-accepting chemotaxis protein
MLEDIQFEESGFCFIVDSTGLMIANPRFPETVGKTNIRTQNANPAVGLGLSEIDDRLLSMYKKVSANWDEALTGVYTFNGSEYDGVLVPVSLQGGQQHWIVAVMAPLAEVNRGVDELFKLMAALSSAFIVFAVLLVAVLSRRIAAPVAILRDECLVMANGDLREHPIRVRSQDETGELARGFAVMKKNLSILISKVQREAENLASASTQLQVESQNCTQAASEISRTMYEVATRSEEQTESTRHVFAAAYAIDDVVQNILNKVRDVSGIALNTSSEAEHGQSAVKKAMTQMKEIDSGSAAVKDAIADLAEGYQEISEIVTLISSMAKQTNLLALNAAIEAARAGEHGRGFAVVAEEVRNLAESSSNAAQKIASLIAENQTKMKQAVTIANSASNGVAVGAEIVTSAGEFFNEIASSIISLSDQIKEVSSSVEKIASDNKNLTSLISGIKEVSETNIADLRGVSAHAEEQLASTEEIAAACDKLASMAAELQGESSSFQV